MRRRIIMKKTIDEMPSFSSMKKEQLIDLSSISSQQQTELSKLLWESFHSTIDDQGESLLEMEQEVAALLSGRYGKFLGEHSFALLEEKSGLYLGCILVCLFRQIPLITYVSVLPKAQGRKLSAILLGQTIESLQASEHQAVYLIVAEGNIPAEKSYQRLGFVNAGENWDPLLIRDGKMIADLQLRPVTRETIEECLALKLGKDQSYVAPVEKSLAYAYVNRELCQPFGIYVKDQIVGYVLVIYDPSDKMYCIWHLVIDERQRGKGYGSTALAQIINYFYTAPFGKGESIGLTCHEKNAAALKLYHNYGFKENGEKDDEDELILIRPL